MLKNNNLAQKDEFDIFITNLIENYDQLKKISPSAHGDETLKSRASLVRKAWGVNELYHLLNAMFLEKQYPDSRLILTVITNLIPLGELIPRLNKIIRSVPWQDEYITQAKIKIILRSEDESAAISFLHQLDKKNQLTQEMLVGVMEWIIRASITEDQFSKIEELYNWAMQIDSGNSLVPINTRIATHYFNAMLKLNDNKKITLTMIEEVYKKNACNSDGRYSLPFCAKYLEVIARYHPMGLTQARKYFEETVRMILDKKILASKRITFLYAEMMRSEYKYNLDEEAKKEAITALYRKMAEWVEQDHKGLTDRIQDDLVSVMKAALNANDFAFVEKIFYDYFDNLSENHIVAAKQVLDALYEIYLLQVSQQLTSEAQKTLAKMEKIYIHHGKRLLNEFQFDLHSLTKGSAFIHSFLIFNNWVNQHQAIKTKKPAPKLMQTFICGKGDHTHSVRNTHDEYHPVKQGFMDFLGHIKQLGYNYHIEENANSGRMTITFYLTKQTPPPPIPLLKKGENAWFKEGTQPKVSTPLIPVKEEKLIKNNSVQHDIPNLKTPTLNNDEQNVTTPPTWAQVAKRLLPPADANNQPITDKPKPTVVTPKLHLEQEIKSPKEITANHHLLTKPMHLNPYSREFIPGQSLYSLEKKASKKTPTPPPHEPNNIFKRNK